VAFVEARQTEAIVASICIGVAIAGAAVAILGLFLSDFDGEESSPVEAGAAPLPGGGGLLSVRGRIP
jgi:hypothetical protein